MLGDLRRSGITDSPVPPERFRESFAGLLNLPSNAFEASNCEAVIKVRIAPVRDRKNREPRCDTYWRHGFGSGTRISSCVFPRANMDSLSPYQLKVGRLVALGHTNRDIAGELKTTEQAIKSALHVIFDKTGCWNRVELASRFLRDASPADRKQSCERMEAARLEELRRQRILDSNAEQVFEEITKMMVAAFDVPIVLVGFMDSGRLWFKSKIGLDVSEVPRELTICHHTIQQSNALVIADAPEDPRFVCNPLVQGFGVRFYAAAPILSNGYALGVVCIVDHVPRQFTTSQISLLTSFARLAAQQLELRRELLDAKQATRSTQAAVGEDESPSSPAIAA